MDYSMQENISTITSISNQDFLQGKIHQHIIDAAYEIFSINGYARTTTRSLASAAGITEVTLFRHFGNKENLFTAVIERYAGSTLAGELEAQFTGEYRSDLTNLGKQFICIALKRSKIMRLMFCEADHFPELAQALALNTRQFRQMLSHYLTQQIEEGKIKKINTEAAAQAFWGMILSYSLIVDTLKEEIPGDITPEEAVTHFVNIFIDGTIQKE
jgi:AcrR family transcriptional regulator